MDNSSSDGREIIDAMTRNVLMKGRRPRVDFYNSELVQKTGLITRTGPTGWNPMNSVLLAGEKQELEKAGSHF